MVGMKFKYKETQFLEEENETKMYKPFKKYITFVRLEINHNCVYSPVDCQGFFISCVLSGAFWICFLIRKEEKKIK